METQVNKRILWIDDDHEILRDLLRDVAEHDVKIDYAGSAYEALEKIGAKDIFYDLIIVDIILPLLPMYDVQADQNQKIIEWKNSENLGILIVKEILRINPNQKIGILTILEEGAVVRKLGIPNFENIFEKQNITSQDISKRILEIIK